MAGDRHSLLLICKHSFSLKNAHHDLLNLSAFGSHISVTVSHKHGLVLELDMNRLAISCEKSTNMLVSSYNGLAAGDITRLAIALCQSSSYHPNMINRYAV